MWKATDVSHEIGPIGQTEQPTVQMGSMASEEDTCRVFFLLGELRCAGGSAEEFACLARQRLAQVPKAPDGAGTGQDVGGCARAPRPSQKALDSPSARRRALPTTSPRRCSLGATMRPAKQDGRPAFSRFSQRYMEVARAGTSRSRYHFPTSFQSVDKSVGHPPPGGRFAT